MAPADGGPAPQEGFPLSFAQEQLWFLDQLGTGASAGYLMVEAFRVRGPLDRAALSAALDAVAERHEALRTRYDTVDGVAGQYVRDPEPVPVAAVDLSALPEAERDRRLRELGAQESTKPIDLRTQNPWRVTLVELAAQDVALLVTVHHIAFDGWSWGILARELHDLYGAFAANEPAPLEPVEVQYPDYAVWQREIWAASAESTERGRAFWRDRLAGLESLELPVDRRRPARWESAGDSCSFTVPAALVEQLTSIGQWAGATPFMVYLAAFQLLLSRYSGQRDVAVGTSIAGRDQIELEQLIGLFVNTLVFRTDLSGDPDFLTLLGRVRETALDAYGHQDVPFGHVVADLAPERDLSRNPVFQVGFALHNAERRPLRLPGLDVRKYEWNTASSAFDLSLHLAERTDGSLAGRLIYPTSLFDHDRIERMAANLLRLLAELAEHPDVPVCGLELVADLEVDRFAEWNRTETPRPDASLAELFFAQAAATPDAVAVVAGPRRIRYAELAQRVRLLTSWLRARGVGRETPVGIAIERGADLVTALLAVLAADGVYVPLAPEQPADRLEFMVQDAGVGLVLTDPALHDRASTAAGARAQIFVLDDAAWDALGLETALCDVAPPAADRNVGAQAAYVMYTSGSTGRPKGVIIPHAAIRNRVLWSVENYGLGPGDRLLQKTTIGFDAAVWEFLSPLVSGATVVMAPADAHRDPGVMARAVAEHEVTVLQLVPSVLRLLLEEPALAECGTLRLVCSAGEPLPADLCTRLRDVVKVEVCNTYGPTECAIDSTAWPFQPDEDAETVPIGTPLPNVRCYVVDPADRLVPIGVVGELCVGGIGLARGYAGRGDLTADRFTPNPYGEAAGERWYRTGDLVRRRADGVLEYVGRIDGQVKVHGVRIEPGEIEAVLGADPAVAAAVVTTYRPTGGSGAELVAYVVPTRGNRVEGDDASATVSDLAGLRERLAARLPEAMIPAVLIEIDALPLTPNGKVDRRRLPDPGEHAQPTTPALEWVAPSTDTEQTVATLMGEILGAERVGAQDDFFLLGGHSLLAIKLVLRLRRAFGIELTVAELFNARTVAALAAGIDAAVDAAAAADQAESPADPSPTGIVPAGRDRDLPLSYGQQRMWFLDQLEPGSDEYVVPIALWLNGPLDVAALRGAVEETAAKHEVLRTRYRPNGGDPVQVVDPVGPVEFTELDLIGYTDAEEQAVSLVHTLTRRPFDLEHDHPLRAAAIRVGPERLMLLLTLHHIAFDAWSMEIYLRDLDSAYRALAAGRPSPLRPQPVQYADFACWQRGQESAGDTAAQLGYWRERLSGLTPVELPADRLRAATRDARGANVIVDVPPALGREVARIAGQCGVTPFMLLLAAFQVLLGRYSGRADVAVGTPVAGRTRQETEDLVGFFTNTLVIRTDLAGEPVFRDVLEQVRRSTLEAFANQDVPFEHLVDALAPERDLSRNPLFQVMFEHQHLAGVPGKLGDAVIEPLRAGLEVAKFDLTVTVKERPDGRLHCWFEYATALFDQTTVERMAGHYLALLGSVVSGLDTRIGDLDVLTAGERRSLLTEWADPAASRLAGLDPADEYELCVPELFARQVARTPDAVAVEFGERRLSYAELNACADRFAQKLRGLGVGAETVVASCLERGIEAVVTLVGVLKAGGVYVPFDPQHPEDRLRFMVADAGAEIVVGTEALRDRLGDGAHRLVTVDGIADICDTPDHPADDDPPVRIRPRQLAYVIYTSGSTGRPKGVMIEHRSYAHHCRVIADAYGVGPGERVVLLSALTFDVAMDQIAATLVAGGTIVVGAAAFWTPAELPARLAEHGVTIMEITPAYYRAMLDSPYLDRLGALKLMNVGSDVVTGRDAQRWAATGLPGRFLCNYGPTEATVTCLLHPVDEVPEAGRAASALPLGQTVPGTRAYVLDAESRPVPVGVPGELCLGGVRLARGYHRRPELTARQFVPDPLSGVPGARLYRTGDLARFRPDGTIEFLGRIDTQVKVRGLRIELGEIEAALARHPAVQEAVVIAAETAPGERQLVGYVVPRPGFDPPDVPALRARLRDLLPEYMIPALWATLDALPLTASRKVDRRALPDPLLVRAEAATAHLAPRDPVEEQVAGIWREVLGLDRIGVDEDFFSLGGHSLLATRVVARLREAFAVDLPLRRLFEATTVAALAEAVVEAVEAAIDDLTDEEVAGLLAEEGAR